jgi:anti-sigma regulatory factor (Ser/Thr protein kinase)
MSCAGSSDPDRRDRRALSCGRSTRHLGTAVFAATKAGVGEARRWLTGRLGAAHPADADALLLLSEAFTNSVLHGTGSKVEVSAFAEPGVVRVEVVDEGGGTLPHYVDAPLGRRRPRAAHHGGTRL